MLGFHTRYDYYKPHYNLCVPHIHHTATLHMLKNDQNHFFMGHVLAFLGFSDGSTHANTGQKGVLFDLHMKTTIINRIISFWHHMHPLYSHCTESKMTKNTFSMCLRCWCKTPCQRVLRKDESASYDRWVVNPFPWLPRRNHQVWYLSTQVNGPTVAHSRCQGN